MQHTPGEGEGWSWMCLPDLGREDVLVWEGCSVLFRVVQNRAAEHLLPRCTALLNGPGKRAFPRS